jgi:hypothetical protein
MKGKLEMCEYLLKTGAIVDAGHQPLIGAAGVFFIFSCP